eukprot:CAMPEP_0174868574 /NCGR_PEP_ID=MMETSP1114-20130205/66218_1 /TAXON_ID=312471 /ORGANISM="Neobodo designis, Strain CCAP 1951/1" /LENGTH=878 /DNA_ID=CAMNT_0016103795 /DNA_START=105 /DNA_END=2738 /DNA_ORIENTATION=+
MRAMRFAAGVHSSSGLGAGGPIRPATINPTADEPVYVTSVTNYMANYLRKNVFFRGLPAFLLLVLSVSVACILRSSTEIIRRSNVALRDTSLNADGFAEARTSVDFYAAARTVLNRAYDSRQPGSITGNGGQRAVAVCSFVIRQYRTRGSISGGVPEILNPLYIPDGGRFNASDPYGTEAVFWFSYPDQDALVEDPIVDPRNASRVFLPNRMRPADELFHGQALDKSGRVYPAGGPQYQLGPIPYSTTTRSDALAIIDAAEASDVWIAQTTKALFIDTMWYSPTSGYFFYGAHSLEVLGSGAVHTSTRSYPFEPIMLHKSSHPRFAVAVVLCVADVALLLSTVAFLANFVNRARLERRLMPASIRGSVRKFVFPVMRFWALYDMAIVVLIFCVLGVRAYLFYLATRTTAEDNANASMPASHVSARAMTALVRMAAATELGDTLSGWLFIGTWLRIFGFLQYIPRLAIVTETVRAAGNDLIGVTAIFMVLVAAFSLIGAVLFSFNVNDFATTARAFDFLVQLVGTGEIDDIAEYEQHSPLASMYFLTFGFIVIAVLLNAIIGILASSFVYTVESFNLVRLSDWSPAAVAASIVALFRRLRRGKEETARDEALVRLFASLDAQLSAASGYVRKRFDETTGAAIDDDDHSAHDDPLLLANATGDADEDEEEEEHENGKAEPSPKNVGTTTSATANASATGPSATQSALLQADDEVADDIVVTLRQLRRLAAPSIRNDAVVADIFRKAQEQRGTSNGKLRYLRVFGRQRLRESDMARDVGAQTVLLAQVQRQLFGGAAKVTDGGDDDDDGGDDALLTGRAADVAGAAASAEDAAALSAAEAARRPMYGFRMTLQGLAAQEEAITRRARYDHGLASDRAKKSE